MRHGNAIRKVLRVALPAAAMMAVTAVAHAEGAEEAASAKDWMWRIIDFAVIAGVLGYLAGPPFRKFLKGRTESIENALAEARAAREEALRRLAEVEARLKDKDTEIKSMLSMAEENGRKEKAQIVQEGEKMGQDILDSARENIGAELFKAREALRKEAALLAVELAEKMVKENISKEDQARILEEYMSKVGGR